MTREERAPSLTALQGLLVAARGIVEQLADDPLVERLKRAFAALPTRDRETILGILERDATWCEIVAASEPTTGITVRANPHASLYLHVFDEAGPTERDRNVIAFGIERFVELVPLFFQEGVHEQWTTSARELILRSADPSLRQLVLRLAHEVIALIEETPAA